MQTMMLNKSREAEIVIAINCATQLDRTNTELISIMTLLSFKAALQKNLNCLHRTVTEPIMEIQLFISVKLYCILCYSPAWTS